MGRVTLTTPLSELIYYLRAGLAKVNQPIKFEVSNSTHYDMKGDSKYGKWGWFMGSHSRLLEMAPFYRVHMSCCYSLP